MSDLAIKLDNVSVVYQGYRDQPASLKEFAVRAMKGDMQTHEVVALDGVSIEVKQGETFGVIGRNGAGKSTLLKVIAQILRPTRGRVRVWGRVRTLLGVGAGFNRDLNGRENIFMYSAMMGRTDKETAKLLDQIVDFSELDGFIDSPVRTYSSGMVARLGFATALADQQEVVLVDEVLAVGDASFRVKCGERIFEMRKSGTTFILVSHNMPEVLSLCQHGAWLEKGKVRMGGAIPSLIEEYSKKS